MDRGIDARTTRPRGLGREVLNQTSYFREAGEAGSRWRTGERPALRRMPESGESSASSILRSSPTPNAGAPLVWQGCDEVVNDLIAARERRKSRPEVYAAKLARYVKSGGDLFERCVAEDEGA